MSNIVQQQQALSSLPRIIWRREAVYSIQRDCDCACSSAPASAPLPFAPLSYSQGATALRAASPFHTLPLTENYQLAYIPSGNGDGDGIAVLNPPALDMLRTLSQKQSSSRIFSAWNQQWGPGVVKNALDDFLRLGFLTRDSSSPYKRHAPRPESDTLSIWLHVTDRCNLRCSYCYLPHRPIDISPEIGKASIDAAFRSAILHDFQRIKIKYAGGEPLLHLPLVLELHRYAKTLAERHSMLLDGIVLSNGTLLTAETVGQLKSSGLRLMISLDDLAGKGKGEDSGASNRCYPDGRSSSAAAVRAVELALARDLIPDISITVSGRNIQDLPALVEWALERSLPFGLNFYREHGEDQSASDLRLEDEKIIEGMRACYHVIENNLPPYSLLSSLIDRANLAFPHTYTCGVGREYMVFDGQGHIAKCQMQMEHAASSVDDTDPLARIRSAQSGIQNIPVDAKEECRACEWKYWCAGGCPLAAYRETGRYDARSPFCRIYKSLYPEVLRLEGLRLLTYSTAS